MHEQSETIQRPDGKWVNTYGRATSGAGKQLPGTQPYDNMATWQVKSDDGLSFTIDAPEDVTEQEVNEFAAENAATWANGGRYAMSVAEPSKPPVSQRNLEAAAAVRSLDEQIAAKQQQVATFKKKTVTPGGAVTAIQPTKSGQAQIGALEAEIAELQSQREKLVIGDKGQTYGGLGGSVLGTGIGIAAGGAIAGPPGMYVGGLLGSIIGGAGGAALGTKLWDIPEARNALDISDQQAAELIKSRAIESVMWDGGFALLFGPGGRLIGKLLDGKKFGPALKAAVKESFVWDDMVNAKKDQLKGVSEKRGRDVPKRFADEVSESLGVAPRGTDAELTGALVRDMAAKSGGQIPTQGGMSGLATGAEAFARRQSPVTFLKNEKQLTEAVQQIRDEALNTLDRSGAYGRFELGQSLEQIVDSADATVKRITGPIFDRAAAQNVAVDMTKATDYMRAILKEDLESGVALLSGPERTAIENSLAALEQPFKEASAAAKARGAIIVEQPITMSPQAAQNFISGNKARGRAVATDGTKPSPFMTKYLTNVNTLADAAYLATLKNVEDPALMQDLLGARRLYRETLSDLYSDAMAKAARQDAEDVGRALTPKGAISEIRDLRKALNRAVTNAPSKSRYELGATGPKLTELGKEAMDAERKRIDAGLIKGFIERNTQSLNDLEIKIRDPEFRDTLKELLLGEGAANPALGRRVLQELDKTVAAFKLVRPELAPQPGKVVSGVGSAGGGTVAAAATGTSVQGAVAVFASWLFGARFLGRAMATAMTTGNTGVFRTIQRAAALAPKAGSSAAAAEALMGMARELDAYDRENGGEGVTINLPPQPKLGR